MSAQSHLCLLFAMQAEAQPLIDKLAMQSMGSLQDHLPMHYFQCQHNGLLISLVLNGQDSRYHVDLVGTEPATLAAQLAVDVLSPDMLITTGTAGGFASRGAEIGTIYLSQEQFVYHDHHVPLEGMDKAGVGHYPSWDSSRMATELGYVTGVMSTGSSLEKMPRDVDVIQTHQAVTKDMESTAVAWVAMLHQIPCLGIRSVTNLVDVDNQSEVEFSRNFDQAVASLTDALVNCLDWLKAN